MLVCVSPSSESYEESISSLNYATRAKKIKTKIPIFLLEKTSLFGKKWKEKQNKIKTINATKYIKKLLLIILSTK